MNAEIMAEWLRRQGRRVEKTADSYWVELAPRVFQAFPYHWTLDLSTSNLRETVRSLRALALRYSSPLDGDEGKISYHVVYAGKDYSLEKLSRKARYDVRKGLSHFKIEQITPAALAAEGWAARLDTLQRQGRSRAENPAWWEKLCLSAEGLSGFECWGARETRTGRLDSSLLACTCGDCFCILYQQSRTESLSLGVNNALSYVVTEAALRRPSIMRVFYGLHSLDAPDSVDAYKFRMRFVATPVRQRVVIHPWIAPFLNRATHAALRGLLRTGFGPPALAKMEGLIRFWREGRRPIDAQEWPVALTDKND